MGMRQKSKVNRQDVNGRISSLFQFTRAAYFGVTLFLTHTQLSSLEREAFFTDLLHARPFRFYPAHRCAEALSLCLPILFLNNVFSMLHSEHRSYSGHGPEKGQLLEYKCGCCAAMTKPPLEMTPAGH